MNTEQTSRPNQYGLTGTVLALGEPRTIGKNEVPLRTVLVSDGAEKWPQELEIEFGGERVKLLDGISKGDRVSITFTIHGREWQERHYVSLRGLSLTRCAPRDDAWAIEEPEGTDQGVPDGMPF